jgi:hypothetical protein
MDRIKNTAFNSFSMAACVCAAAGTCLRSRCLATIGGVKQAHRQQGNLISLLLFFQNKDSRLKNAKPIINLMPKIVTIQTAIVHFLSAHTVHIHSC